MATPPSLDKEADGSSFPSLDELLEGVSTGKVCRTCRNEDLCEIAQSVTNWKGIAPFLGLTKAEIEAIEVNERKVETQRVAMLDKWKEKLGRKATYWKLAKAFWKVKRADLVDVIRRLLVSYGESSSSDESSPTLSGDSHVESCDPPRSVKGQHVLSSSSTNSYALKQQPRASLPLDFPISGSDSPQACRGPLPGSNAPIPHLAKIPEEREELRIHTDKERFQHATTFSKMFVKLGSLLATKLEVDDLTGYLDALVDPHSNLPYVDRASYKSCSTTKQVLRSLCPRYIHAYHLDLLKEIVDLSESAEAKAFLNQYESTLPYSIPLSQLESPLTEDDIKACRSSTEVQIIVNRDPNSFTLKDEERIKRILEQATGVSRVVIVFVKHQPGSVVLTFLIPEIAAEHFVNIEANKAKLAMLAELHVVEIKVGEGIWFSVPTHMQQSQSDPGVPHITLLEAGGMLSSLQLEDESALPKSAEAPPSKGTTVQEQKSVSSPSASSKSPTTSKMVPNTGMASSVKSSDSSYGGRTSPSKSADSGYDSRASSLMSVDSGYGSRASSLMSADSGLGSTRPLLPSRSRAAISSKLEVLIKQLTHNQTGPTAELFGTHIGGEGAKQLAEALKGNQTVRNLRLFDTHIGDEGAKQLAEALKGNQTLRNLELQGVRLGPGGAGHIAEALKANWTLLHLTLRGSQIGSGGATHVANGLKVNSSLQHLDLSGNQIGDEGAINIAKAVEMNSTLQHLDLSGNQIGDEGAINIAKAVETNSTLQHLNLSWNKIGSDGATHVANGLKVNSSLQHIDLRRNQIRDEGAIDIAKAVEANSTLQHLDLSGNQIGDEGAINIAKAMETNMTLQHLKMWENPISPTVKDRLRAVARTKEIHLGV